MDDAGLRKRLLSVLYSQATGPENAKTADELAALCGIRSTRQNVELRKLLRELVLEGHPICSVTGGRRRGYYIATMRSHLTACRDSLNRRIANTVTRREAYDRAIAAWDEKRAA